MSREHLEISLEITSGTVLSGSSCSALYFQCCFARLFFQIFSALSALWVYWIEKSHHRLPAKKNLLFPLRQSSVNRTWNTERPWMVPSWSQGISIIQTWGENGMHWLKLHLTGLWIHKKLNFDMDHGSRNLNWCQIYDTFFSNFNPKYFATSSWVHQSSSYSKATGTESTQEPSLDIKLNLPWTYFKPQFS